MALLSAPLPIQKPKSFSSFLIAVSLLIGLLYVGRLFFITIVISVILAFILEPGVKFVMRARLPRPLASFVICSVALLFLYLLGLGVYTQVSILIEDLPNYSMRISELIDGASLELERLERSAYEIIVPKRIRDREAPAQQEVQPQRNTRKRRAAEPPMPPPIQEVRIRQERPPLLQTIWVTLQSFYDVLLMASFVPFLVYFMLSWSDHLRRAFLQLFEGPDRQIAGKTWEGIANLARAYMVGNFLLGVLLSIASSAFFYFVKLPYWILVGPISGFLSLVPYVGLPLSIVPPILAALPVYDKLAPYLVIGTTVAFFHLLALNLLYPKLVGSRVHLNPLVVTIALMFWGMLWGGVGLILAVPITAGIKAVCDNVADWQPYGKLLGD
ncbi:MAG: AI-2E family transporter [Bryobacteraceae bacterium]|nr:AI-2E family transporter [Bryobacteraceae bacterium]